MSKQEKLAARLSRRPKDFTWKELTALLNQWGYVEAKTGKTGGSRRRFTHLDQAPITLHKPRPGHELKAYQVIRSWKP